MIRRLASFSIALTGELLVFVGESLSPSKPAFASDLVNITDELRSQRARMCEIERALEIKRALSGQEVFEGL